MQYLPGCKIFILSIGNDMMKKKVLIIGPGMEIGGVERSLLGLLDAINYDKYEVDLFLFSHTGEFMPFINKNVHLLSENKMFSYISWPIIKLVKSGKFLIASIRLFSKMYGDLRAIIKKTATINTILCNKIVTLIVPKNAKHYDFALGFFGPHYYLGHKIDADLKIGWIHTDCSHPAEFSDSKDISSAWHNIDYVACVSENVKNSFDKIYPSLKDKTIVIENIFSSEFVINRSNEFSVKQEMPDDAATKILSVGRFCTAKAFDDVVIACNKLVEKGYNFKWYLIGYGPDEELIKNLINEYQLQDTVIVLGKKDNPYPYIKECDIYAQPSRYEGKAVTVIEAQILNKPVMITRYTTSAAQLRESVDGYICEMGVDGVVDGIEFLINNPDYREKLIENTKQTNYDNSYVADQIFNIKETKNA